MSDFGSIILINKKENKSFTEEEVNEITIICNQLKKETTLKNSLGEAYLFKVGKTISFKQKNQCFGVNVLLSEYWGNESDFKWNSEVDSKNMKVFADNLCLLIPKGCILQPKFEWW